MGHGGPTHRVNKGPRAHHPRYEREGRFSYIVLWLSAGPGEAKTYLVCGGKGSSMVILTSARQRTGVLLSKPTQHIHRLVSILIFQPTPGVSRI